jgi:hypothetical protein
MQGDRKEVTRKGTANSGIRAHIRGWDVGVKVVGKVYGKTKKQEGYDYFEIFATGGSNGKNPSQKLGTVRLSETDGTVQFYNE